ncbi:peroxiredoxin [Thiomicrorhabdus aquaedulcis]|uniref:peroxiredoxin n=1 Tax=Thiomicrorhabdus aquaedulcis TaxID=2211106 RepID=UPI001E475775|nr:peroxiredoxin [Thiomicrorhabdus aquaedulcis]
MSSNVIAPYVLKKLWRLVASLSLILGVFVAWFIPQTAQASGLKLGDDAPLFSLTNQHLKTIELKALQGKWVVVYFYPKNETPGCTTEACSFRDNINRLIAQDAVVLGISLDTVESHQAFAKNHNLPFDLLADTDGKVAASFDALLDLKMVKFAKRHSFIINPQGKLAKIYRDVNTDTHVRDVLKDLQTLQTQP